MACNERLINSLAEGEGTQFQVLVDNENKHEVNIRRWDDKMLKLYEQNWLEVVEEESTKNAFFAEVWKDLSEFRKNYSVWERNAYLPRKR